MAERTRAQLEHVRRLIADADDLEQGEIEAWKQRARLAVASIFGSGSDQLEQFDFIRWSPGAWSDSSPPDIFDRAERGGLRNARSMLQAVAEDIQAHIGEEPIAPAVNPRELHQWVADAAASLWEDGYHAEAVQKAASDVEQRLQLKMGVHTGSTATLCSSAFSPAAPKEGQPRLRFQGYREGSDAWKSAHEGAGSFGRGCMMRIRNLYSHRQDEGKEPEAIEQEALEGLAALSLLARWIDEAELEKAEGE